MQAKKLYRSNTNRIIAGVCGGIGEYFGLDPIIIRVIFIILTFLGLSGLLVYFISMFIIPSSPNKNGGEANGSFSGIKQSNVMLFVGVGIIGFGVLIMLNELDLLFFPFSFNVLTTYTKRLFWPILLIMIGFLLIYSYKKSPMKNGFDETVEGLKDFQTKLSGDKRLYRSRTDRKVLGVCGGISEHLGIDSSIVRIVFVLSLFFANFFGIIAYFIAALVIPEKPIERISHNMNSSNSQEEQL